MIGLDFNIYFNWPNPCLIVLMVGDGSFLQLYPGL